MSVCVSRTRTARGCRFVRVALAGLLVVGVLAGVTVGSAATTQAGPPKSTTVGAAANRIVVWVNASSCADITDAMLDALKSDGIGGLACSVEWLPGMGGAQRFTGASHQSLAGSSYKLQRTLRSNHVAQRLHARHMSMYLVSYMANYYNVRTPLAPWNHDAAWRHTVLPAERAFAGAARLLGCNGIGFDQELYPQRNNVATATWASDYPGRTQPTLRVRAEAKRRGRQVMKAVLAGFPRAQILAYDTFFPGDWNAYLQAAVNHIHNAFTDQVMVNFWDGMTSVDGYSGIHFLEAIFYKSTQSSSASWNTAIRYDDSRTFALMSRRFSNWAYAADRVSVTPFAWIDAGPGSYGSAQPPAVVKKQLAAFRRWGMDGMFADYSWAALGTFNYGPYVSAIRAAARSGKVDTRPPVLTIGKPVEVAGGVKLSGRVRDNFAVRVVRWSAGMRHGAARLTTRCRGRTPAVWVCHTSWTIPAINVGSAGSPVILSAEDVKGNQSTKRRFLRETS